MIDEYAVTLSNVSSGEADILTTAIDDRSGYVIERGTTPNDPFQSLSDRFRTVEDVDAAREADDGSGEGGSDGDGNEGGGEGDGDGENRRSGTYLVRYDGALYWTRLRIFEPATTTE